MLGAPRLDQIPRSEVAQDRPGSRRAAECCWRHETPAGRSSGRLWRPWRIRGRVDDCVGLMRGFGLRSAVESVGWRSQLRFRRRGGPSSLRGLTRDRFDRERPSRTWKEEWNGEDKGTPNEVRRTGGSLVSSILGDARLNCRAGSRGGPNCWAPVEASVASRRGCPSGTVVGLRGRMAVRGRTGVLVAIVVPDVLNGYTSIEARTTSTGEGKKV